MQRNRRLAGRVPPERTPWHRCAMLRPGQEIVVLNLSRGGALVESPTRLVPGTRTELQLFGDLRRSVRGRVERCRVSCLEPLRYEGAIVFDHALELPGVARCHG
jgi:hypothetical protein